MVLKSIGALAVSYYGVRLLLIIRQAVALWSMSRHVREPLFRRYGEWAVVTGSTDGIGKQYALQLAQRGINVVLISRNPHKLRTVAEEIETKYGVKTKTIVADFTEGPKVYAHIKEELRDVSVGILVNNVGVLDEHPMRFCDVELERVWEMVSVNVVTVVSMCRLLLPGMLRRNRGAVVNLSSATGWQAVPLASVYASTKAFINSFTIALQEEYADTNIDISLVYPLLVSTNMTAFSETISKGEMFIPDAASYTNQAVSSIGTFSATAGYWSQVLQVEFLLMLPMWMRVKISGYLSKELQMEHLKGTNNKIC